MKDSYKLLRTSLIFIAILIYGSSNACILKRGDLLFVVEEESAFSEAIASATGDSLNITYIHVAIFDNENRIIEATPKCGVRAISLDKFLSSAPEINGFPGVVVMRITEKFPVDKVIENAESHIGEAYDWHFMPDNGEMYCSELVFESYKDELGNHMFGNHPMNFRNQDGTMPDFWISLYKKLGEPIPEGEPGTNPNDMSKEKILMEVFRYF